MKASDLFEARTDPACFTTREIVAIQLIFKSSLWNVLAQENKISLGMIKSSDSLGEWL